jgi:hypothetical protein
MERPMTSNGMKRAIGFAVFGLGILGGLWGCVASAGGVFTIGLNDSYQEILAITIGLMTPLPVCILALWKRLFAGLWLIFAGCFFTYGMVAQRTYMIVERHFPDQPTVEQVIKSSLPVSLVLVALGLFAVITDRLKWPKLLGDHATTNEVNETP